MVHDLVPLLNSLPQLDAWRNLACKVDRPLPAVLQVDTGMARLGLPPQGLDVGADDPERLRGLALRFLMSHLASAKDQANPANHPPLASDLLVS